jgi:hypothetical protein
MSAHSLRVKELACLACEIEGVQQPSITESHHQNLGGLAGQKRLGDTFQIPLCGWHHRGEPPRNVTKSEATYIFGPSLACDSKQFRFCYGTDDQLLALTNDKLRRLA